MPYRADFSVLPISLLVIKHERHLSGSAAASGTTTPYIERLVQAAVYIDSECQRTFRQATGSRTLTLVSIPRKSPLCKLVEQTKLTTLMSLSVNTESSKTRHLS